MRKTNNSRINVNTIITIFLFVLLIVSFLNAFITVNRIVTTTASSTSNNNYDIFISFLENSTDENEQEEQQEEELVGGGDNGNHSNTAPRSISTHKDDDEAPPPLSDDDDDATAQQDQHHLDPNRVHHSDSTISSFNNKIFDSIVNQTNQVFMTMPCKAAGMTMLSFTQKCTNMNTTLPDPPNNFINRKDEVENLLSIRYELPSIIASHLYSDVPFVHLVNGATRETLIIYIHREELSRVRSAIQHVLMSKICVPHVWGPQLMERHHFSVERNENKCTIDEQSLIKLIKNRVQEVGNGAPEILTCRYFDAIAQNTPSNLMFVHYKQADKLQKMLAKYHCPHLIKDLPFAVNVADKKDVELFVQLNSNTSRNVTFTEWFDKKQNVILWTLDSNRKMDCQSKIIDMEDHLFSCPDEAMTLFRGEFKCVSLSNGTD
jgi:hypothetical protein